ncbi:hypothetical protein [Methanosarcina vacuolata]|nr:hypothetical protein [Methanosarcina vacuolata]
MKRKEPEDRKKSARSCFSKSESAAATVIIAVLLLALAFTMIAVVKLEYVPDWKNDAERDHMYNTLDEMAGVKTSIDILSRLTELNNSSNYNISVTVPVDMGGGQIPFLEPSKSDGKLSVNTERCAMTIVPNRPALKIEPDNFTIECGGITCYSENRQYPNQIFRYENGALILANDKSSVMRQQPVLIIEKNETNESNCTIRIHAVQLLGKRDSTSSNTVIPLQLTGYKTEPVYDSDDDKNTGRSINAFNMTISTRYPDAWITYLKETAQDQGLNGTDYTVQYLRGSGHVRFSFLPNGNKTLERLCVNKTIIGVELGSGDSFDYNHIPGLIEKVKKLHYFNTVSSTEVNLSYLKDYSSSSGVDFSTESTGEILSTYSSSSYYSHNLNGNPLNLTFGFNNSTKLEPNSPSSITLIMIYQPTFKNPSYQSMTIAGKVLPTMTGNSQNTWYLYNQTTNISSISGPSNLTFNLKINSENKDRAINIDYLAVYLS